MAVSFKSCSPFSLILWVPSEVSEQFIEDSYLMAKLPRLITADIDARKHITKPIDDLLLAK